MTVQGWRTHGKARKYHDPAPIKKGVSRACDTQPSTDHKKYVICDRLDMNGSGACQMCSSVSNTFKMASFSCELWQGMQATVKALCKRGSKRLEGAPTMLRSPSAAFAIFLIAASESATWLFFLSLAQIVSLAVTDRNEL